jgi:hypothetical protein
MPGVLGRVGDHAPDQAAKDRHYGPGEHGYADVAASGLTRVAQIR